MTCKAPPRLTAEERAALDLARSQGGKLHRHDEGWGVESLDLDAMDVTDYLAALENIYSGLTVRRLVSKGFMRFSKYDGLTPVRVEIRPGVSP